MLCGWTGDSYVLQQWPKAQLQAMQELLYLVTSKVTRSIELGHIAHWSIFVFQAVLLFLFPHII